MVTVEKDPTTASNWSLNGNGTPPGSPDDEFDDQPMTLVEHLKELRDRLIRMAIGIVIGMVIGYFFTNPVINYFRDVVKRNDPNANLIVTDPTEYVSTFLKITFYLGIAFAMPVLVYQLIRFLAPGLTRRERRYIYGTLPFVILFFVLGVLFATLIAIPNMFHFLLGLGRDQIQHQLRISEVLGFFSNLALWSGVFFEMPIVIFVLAALNIVQFATLRRTRRYASVGLMIVAAVITPTPDALSMLIVWAPMYALYELGLVLAWIVSRRRKPETA